MFSRLALFPRLTVFACLVATYGASTPARAADPEVGAWSDAFVLELPPAPRNTRPSLALVTAPGADEGPFGRGTRLAGTSVIERRAANGGWYVPGGPTEFRVDGQRLAYVGTAGSAISYRLADDDNRVFVYDAATEEWTARRDGWTWRYGGGHATDHNDRGMGAVWHLTGTEDPAGNAIVYRYAQVVSLPAMTPGILPALPGVPELIGVDYAAGHAQVTFTYVQRPDIHVTATAAGLRLRSRRVASIAVSGGTVGTMLHEVAHYDLAYRDDDPTPCDGEATLTPPAHTVLHRIVQVGTSGGSRTVRCVTANDEITWRTASGAVGFSGATWGGLAHSVSVVNFDGDALPDLLWYPAASITLGGLSAGAVGSTSIYANIGDGTFFLDPLTTDILRGIPGAMHFADVDGDGRTDVVSCDGDTVRVHTSILTDCDTSSCPGTTVMTGADCYEPGQAPDLNGDGFPELLISDGTDYQVYWNDGGSFRAAGAALTFPIVWTTDGVFPQFEDFNGDGALDRAFPASLEYGDGTGHFVPSGLLWPSPLGTFALADVHAVADADGDGRPELVDTEFDTHGWPTLRIREYANALAGVASGARAHTVDGVALRRDTNGTAIADFDADGVEDLLTYDSLAHDVTLHRGQRSAPADYPLAIARLAGGSVAVTHAPSSATHSNMADLPFVRWVISSVNDAAGTTEFSFSEPRYAAGRFLGFADCQVRLASGRIIHERRATSDTLLGALISHAEYNAECALDTFEVYSYVLSSLGSYALDTLAPRFNPVRRTCTFAIGDSVSTEDSLTNACLTSAAGVPSASHLWQAYGWDAQSGTPARSDRSDRPNRSALPESDAQSIPLVAPDQLTPLTPPVDGFLESCSATRSYPPLSGRAHADLVLPPTPVPPARARSASPDYTLRIVDLAHDGDQRLAAEYDLADPGMSGDDVTRTYQFAAWDAAAEGKATTQVATYDHTGTLVLTTERFAFAAFDQPGAVRETAGSEARQWVQTYDRGLVEWSYSPEGVTTSARYDVFGSLLGSTDGVGRETLMTHDTAGRMTSWEHAGSRVERVHDEFGRLLSEVTTLALATTATVHHYYEATIDTVDVRGTWREAREATVDADGVLTLDYLDPWGRLALRRQCSLFATPAAGTYEDLESQFQCIDTPTWTYVGYDEAGRVRVRTPAFEAGAVVPGDFVFADEQDRAELTLTPAPVLVTTTGEARYVTRTTAYAPSRMTVTDPMGNACSKVATTLDETLTCGGVSQGSTQFDEFGRVTRREDGDGVARVLDYDAFGRVARNRIDAVVTGCDGAAFSPARRYRYDRDDRLVAFTTADGTTSLAYDAADRLVARSYQPDSSGTPIVTAAWTYVDDTTGVGTRVEHADVSGNVWRDTLDGAGRLVARELPTGESVAQTFTAGGQRWVVTDADGATHRYRRDHRGRVLSATHLGTDGTRSTQTFAYDDLGRLARTTDADGITTHHAATWNGAEASAARGAHLLSRATYRDDGLTAGIWREGSWTSFDYDSQGRATTVCRFVGAAGSCGQRLAATYTPGGRVATNSVGTIATFTHHYDAAGQLDGMTNPDGTTVTNTFDAMGRLCAQTDELGYTASALYDAWGRPVLVDPIGADPTRYAYAFGVDGSALGLGTGLSTITTTLPDGATATEVRDALGRVVHTTRPDGTWTQFDYVGERMVAERALDAAGTGLSRTTFAHDGLGRLTQRWGPVSEARYSATGGVPGTNDYVFAYAYSDAGRTTGVTGPNDQTEFLYDADGLLTTERIVGITDITYAYAPDSTQITGRTAGSGPGAEVTAWEYVRGRRVRETASAAHSLVDRQWGDFDDYGRARREETRTNGGQPTIHVRTTNAMGRVTLDEVTIAGESLGTVAYGYYANGTLARVDVPWAGTIAYEHGGPEFALARVTDGSTQVYATYLARDGAGRATHVGLHGGGHIQTEYDALGRIARQLTGDGAGDVQARTNVYDARGRLVHMRESLSGRDDAYRYMEPGWLSEERQSSGGVTRVIQYAYDAAGNRTWRDDDGAVTHYGIGYGNRLVDVDGAPIVWNVAGGIARNYDGFEIARYGDGTEESIRDAAGHAQHTFLRDADGLPVADRRPGAAFAELQLWGNPGDPGLPLAGRTADGDGLLYVAAEGMLLARVEGGTALQTASGSRGALTLLGTEEPTPPSAFGDDVALPTSAAHRYVYGRLELLGDTPGWMLARHRLYDARVGRFMSRDPIGLAGGDHRFTYANNDPVRHIDPMGHSAVDLFLSQRVARQFATPRATANASPFEYVRVYRGGRSDRERAPSDVLFDSTNGDLCASTGSGCWTDEAAYDDTATGTRASTTPATTESPATPARTREPREAHDDGYCSAQPEPTSPEFSNWDYLLGYSASIEAHLFALMNEGPQAFADNSPAQRAYARTFAEVHREQRIDDGRDEVVALGEQIVTSVVVRPGTYAPTPKDSPRVAPVVRYPAPSKGYRPAAKPKPPAPPLDPEQTLPPAWQPLPPPQPPGEPVPTAKNAVFQSFNQDTHRPPSQGWKIHVSATPETRDYVVAIVKAELGDRYGFKTMFPDPMRDFTAWGDAQATKAVTVYPVASPGTQDNAAAALEVAARLEAAFVRAGLPPVPIAGDVMVGTSGRVWARYGALTSAHGDKILGPDGQLEPDPKSQGLAMPEWQTNIFERYSPTPLGASTTWSGE